MVFNKCQFLFQGEGLLFFGSFLDLAFSFCFPASLSFRASRRTPEITCRSFTLPVCCSLRAVLGFHLSLVDDVASFFKSDDGVLSFRSYAFCFNLDCLTFLSRLPFDFWSARFRVYMTSTLPFKPRYSFFLSPCDFHPLPFRLVFLPQVLYYGIEPTVAFRFFPFP